MKSQLRPGSPQCGVTAGFTLTELLVCIAMVAILTVIALPMFTVMRDKAAVGKCVLNLRQLGAAVHLYATENAGELPRSVVSEGLIASGVGERYWYHFLQNKDVGNYDGNGVLPNENFEANDPKRLTVYNCPANPYRVGNKWATPSYAYNWALGLDEKKVKMNRIPEPARTVLMVDAGYRRDINQSPDKGPSKQVSFNTSYARTASYWERSVNFEVHKGPANFLMVDGHVEPLSRSEVAQRGMDKTLLWSRDNISLLDGIW